ncbi:MAG: Hsp20/alpha crystallin family protein [Bacteroidetes bacterium]|nr:Hsp20/alpha crystallin family protein [Bacteroidota bacterium]
MTKIIARPRNEFDVFPRYFRHMFEDINRELGAVAPTGSYVPRVNISEDAQNIYVAAELPGMTKEDVKITVTEGVLTIRGEKKSEAKQEGRNYHRIERRFGEFVRQFTLPDNVQEENVHASFKDGVLEVVVPKKEPAKPKERQIEISVN